MILSSSASWIDMLTTFSLQTDFDFLNRVTSPNTKPEVVLRRRCCHLKNRSDVITPLHVGRFGFLKGGLCGAGHNTPTKCRPGSLIFLKIWFNDKGIPTLRTTGPHPLTGATPPDRGQAPLQIIIEPPVSVVLSCFSGGRESLPVLWALLRTTRRFWAGNHSGTERGAPPGEWTPRLAVDALVRSDVDVPVGYDS